METTMTTPNAGLEGLVASELVESYIGFMLTRGGFDEFWFSVDDDTRQEIIADLERNAASILTNTRTLPGAEGDARDAAIDASCRIVAADAGENFDMLDPFTQSVLRDTQKASIDAYLDALASRRELGGVVL
jgi:hypothetical protein